MSSSLRRITYFAVLAFAATNCLAQVERYELGKRLKRVELAWESADSVHRARAVKPMEQAVRSFFSFQLRTAAARLDDAYFLIRFDEAPKELERFAVAQRIAVQPLLADQAENQIRIQRSNFYDLKTEISAPDLKKCQLKLELRRLDKSIVESTFVEIPEVGKELLWTPSTKSAGDLLFTAAISNGAMDFALLDTQISRVDKFSSRLMALEQPLEKPAAELSATSLASLRDWRDLIIRLQKGEILESDYPAARLMELAEAIVANPTKSNEIFLAAASDADIWLTLSNQKQELPVRVRAPSKVDGPLPVFILFHGAGGSENMFFETYGSGRAVSLGLDRGWLVVAPRQGLLGIGMNCEQMLDSLSEIFPIDRQRVAILGHSMGAGQVVSQANLKPELFRAAVALGGGGAIPKAERVKTIHWHVGAGEFDFGRGGAASLARSLNRAGIPVDLKNYVQVEHMMVVQAALDEVFRFLDTAMK